MAAHPRCIAQLSRTTLANSLRPSLRPATQILLPLEQFRTKATKGTTKGFKKPEKKKKQSKNFKVHDLKDAQQFNLYDAMQYIRAFEVGQPPSGPKYELHVKLRSVKNGPVLRNRVRLPHPVKTDVRIGVIVDPNSKAAADARKAGASLVGEDAIFDAVKEGRIEFDRLLCHADSLPKLAKTGLGRVLGPRGLMPSAKTGTVVKDVVKGVKDMVGGSEYRERLAVVSMAVGQLGFTPEELQRNIKFFMANLRTDINALSDRIVKTIHEVVLSSTHSPGFSLTGELKGPQSVSSKDLST